MISILIAAKSGDDLTWSQEYAEALAAKESGKRILWVLDLGIDPICSPLTDEAVFAQRALALTTFSKFLAPFLDVTEGVVLAKSLLFRLWHERDSHEETLGTPDDSFKSRLKSMTLFADYLHRLASFLPEEVKVLVSIEEAGEKRAEKEILLSKERFRHIVAQEERDVMVACVLPEDDLCHQKTREGLEAMFAGLEKQNLVFRCIPEALLNEEWSGLETLVFYAPAMTRVGVRMAQGFTAAGGKVLYYE